MAHAVNLFFPKNCETTVQLPWCLNFCLWTHRAVHGKGSHFFLKVLVAYLLPQLVRNTSPRKEPPLNHAMVSASTDTQLS